jgi:hypothetical protein
MMFLNAGRILYLGILAAFSKVAKSGLLGSLRKPHFNGKSGMPALRSAGIRRDPARRIVELEAKTSLNNAERTVI